MSILLETLERELREWLAARLRDPYKLDSLDYETARDILRLWQRGVELGFPSVRLEREAFGRRAERIVPAGASCWQAWLMGYADTVWLDSLYRAVIPPRPIRRGGGRDGG